MGFQTIQPSFTAGELSPSLAARADLAKYACGAKTLKNFIVHAHGGVSNRPGFEYIADACVPEGKSRLIPFIFSKDQAYLLEFSNERVRFFFQGELLKLEDGTVYEVVSPYFEGDLQELRFSQSADVLFLCHPRYLPRKLVRLGHLAWQFEDFSPKEGPMLRMNTGEGQLRVKNTTTLANGPIGEKRYTAVGAFSFTVPDGVKKLRIQMIGGGAGYQSYLTKEGNGSFLISDTEHTAYRISTGGTSSFANLHAIGGNGAVGGINGAVAANTSGFISNFVKVKIAESEFYGASGYFSEKGTFAGGGRYAGKGYGAGSGGYKASVGDNSFSTSGGKAGTVASGYLDVKPGEIISGTIGSGGGSNCGLYGANGCVDISWQSSSLGRQTGLLESTDDCFKPDHVGSLWRVRHSLPAQTVKGVNGSGVLDLTVIAHSRWYLETSGYWRGTIRVEKFDSISDEWKLIRTLSSQKDRNYSESGSVDENTQIRVTGDPFIREVPAGGDGSMLGSVTLETAPTAYDGFVKIIEYLNAREVKIEVEKQIGSLDWTADWAEGAWSGVRGYPGCCTFYQDRLCFGGTEHEPGTIWMSRTGDYNHFGVSLPVEDSDGITARLVSRKIGRIRALTGVGDLIALTESGEWKISSAKGVVTPATMEAWPQGYWGSSNLEPITIGNKILFIREMGSTVQDFGYSFESDSYSGNDISLLSKHLFSKSKFLAWDYQQEPDSVVWLVRNDGILLGLTYVRDQQVWAWHRHETDGFIEGVACIPGLEQNELWLLIRRNGNLRVERMARRSGKLQDSFYVDSGITWESTTQEKIRKIGGLDHLANRRVAIVADGCVLPQQTVRKIEKEGDEFWGVELSRPAEKIHIGLPYSSELETLNLEIQTDEGTFQGKKKKFARVTLRVKSSCGGKIGTGKDQKMDDIQWHSGENYGAGIQLFTGDKSIRPPGGYTEDGRILILQEDPLPFHLLAIIPEVVAGG